MSAEHVLNKCDQFRGVKRRLSTMSSWGVPSCVFGNQGHSRLVPGAWVFVALRLLSMQQMVSPNCCALKSLPGSLANDKGLPAAECNFTAETQDLKNSCHHPRKTNQIVRQRWSGCLYKLRTFET